MYPSTFNGAPRLSAKTSDKSPKASGVTIFIACLLFGSSVWPNAAFAQTQQRAPASHLAPLQGKKELVELAPGEVAAVKRLRAELAAIEGAGRELRARCKASALRALNRPATPRLLSLIEGNCGRN